MDVSRSSDAEPQDEAVFAALAAPLFIDVYGHLYALRADGATICVAGSAAKGRVRFFRPCTGGAHKWVATNEKIYLLINGSQKFLLTLDEGSFNYTDIVPQYSPVFPMSGSSQSIGLSTLRGLASIEIDENEVTWPGLHTTMYGLGGWVDGDSRHVAGMSSRRHSVDEGHGRGKSAILHYTHRSTRAADLDEPRVDGDEIISRLGNIYPTHKRMSFGVECWLHVAKCNEMPLLVGGIVDSGLFEDDWMLSSIPSDTDFNVIGIFRYDHRQPQLKAVSYPYRFRQSVSVENEVILYMQCWERSAGNSVTALRSIRINRNGDVGDPRLLRVAGLSSTLPVSFIDLHYDDRVRFYGALVLSRTFASHECYLIRSEDGENWRVMHSLTPVPV